MPRPSIPDPALTLRPWAEQHSSGTVIEWRPHLLSAGMSVLQLRELVYEPLLNPRPEPAGADLALRVSREGIDWAWGRFRVLSIAPQGARPGRAIRRDFVRRNGEANGHCPWTGLSAPGGAIEITPWTIAEPARPSAGLTTLVPVPAGCGDNRVRFDWNRSRRTLTATVVGFEPSTDLARRQDWLAILALELLQGPAFRVVASAQLVPPRGEISLDESFRGIVAVVAGQPTRLRRVVDACQVTARSVLGRPNDEEWACVCASLDLDPSPLTGWPTRTREGLGALSDLAQKSFPELTAECAQKHSVRTPTGLLRLLVLHVLHPSFDWSEDLVHRLDDGGFDAALDTLWPGVNELAARTASPAESTWVYRHAGEPWLGEVVDWAHGSGPEGLACAASLAPARRRVQHLLAEVRPDSTLGHEARRLAAAIEAAPGVGSVPPFLAADLEGIERGLQADKRRPIAVDAPPPQTLTAYRDWALARDRQSAWRKAVTNVVAFCWRGVGGVDRDANASAEHSFDQSIAALCALPRIAPRRRAGEPPDGVAFLQAELVQIEHEAAAEPDTRLRAIVIEVVARLKRTEASWARRAGLLATVGDYSRSYPELAGRLGVSRDPVLWRWSDLNTAARLARIARAARQYADTWRPKAICGRGLVPALLTNPSHPVLVAAVQEMSALHTALAGSLHGCDKPIEPVEPRTRLADWRVYWDWLSALDTYLDHGRRGAADLVRQARWAEAAGLLRRPFPLSARDLHRQYAAQEEHDD